MEDTIQIVEGPHDEERVGEDTDPTDEPEDPHNQGRVEEDGQDVEEQNQTQ